MGKDGVAMSDMGKDGVAIPDMGKDGVTILPIILIFLLIKYKYIFIIVSLWYLNKYNQLQIFKQSKVDNHH